MALAITNQRLDAPADAGAESGPAERQVAMTAALQRFWARNIAAGTLICGLAALPALGTVPVACAQDSVPATAGADSAADDAASKAFFAGDYGKAKQLWEKLAADNDPVALTNLGIMYQKGIGAKRDVKMAETLYLRAANLGYAQGQFDLANLYYNGDGIKQDYKAAGRWYMAAALSGHLPSQYYLAQMYDHGEGTKEDKGQALSWYVKAADGGLPQAKYVVGRKLLTGEDIQQDHPKAIPYLLDAADGGVPDARAWLGVAYYNGWGTPKNLVAAYMWLELALDRLPAGELQQKAYNTLRDAEGEMTQAQLDAAKRMVAKAQVKQKQD